MARSRRCVSLHLCNFNARSWLKSNAGRVSSEHMGRQTADSESVVRVGKQLIEGSGERGKIWLVKTRVSSGASPVSQA